MPVNVDLNPTGEYIRIETEWRFKELCKSIPGATWNAGDQAWRVPLGWSSCLALRSVFKNELAIGPALSAWAANELATRVAPANELRDLDTYEGDEALFPHQRAGVAFLSTARRALLADEPGLGKTAQAIRALKKLSETSDGSLPALIVCPNTLKKNWKREFARWWPEARLFADQQVNGASSLR